MTATNHVITGVVIGSVISSPVLALPLAFFSHFVLDSLPHYDISESHKDKKFLYSLAADCGLATGILLSVLFLVPFDTNVWIALAGVSAASPDLMWFMPWIRELQGKKPRTLNKIERFHSKIQRYARHSLATFAFETVWLIAMTSILIVNLG